MPARHGSWNFVGKAGAVLLLGLTLLAWQVERHDVPTEPSELDRRIARQLLTPLGLTPVADAGTELTYAEQVRRIRQVQGLVLALAPSQDGIPLGQPRELINLIAHRGGLCYDRSRSMEMLLRVIGFTVRHASIYAVEPGGSVIASLLKPGDPSHAVPEVLTAHGWLVVDSNFPWISQDRLGEPVSLAAMEADAKAGQAATEYRDGLPSVIFRARFTYVVGLYSRHGRFYPPFDGVPDVSLKEALLSDAFH